MPETRVSTVSFSEFGTTPMSDEQFVAAINATMAPVAATLVTGQAAPSVEFKTNFIAAARPGKFIAKGSVVRAGKSIAFTEAKMWDGESKLIATAAVTSQLVAAARLVDKAAAK
jgi:acyl-coenzyme A thioesterase PaaI-like protein